MIELACRLLLMKVLKEKQLINRFFGMEKYAVCSITQKNI